jgi:peptide/nickel transport system ATP-binding protein
MSKSILEVEDLRVYYNTVLGDYQAVDGVSFKANKDEILGIAGESGCGKSTLVEGVLQIVKPPGYIASGKVIYNGVDLVGLDEESMRKLRVKDISYVPQGSMNSLNPVMRVENQMAGIILAHKEASKEDAEMMASALLKSVALPPETNRMFPHELSGGMKQRILIGTALSLDPQIIVADEPTTALDLTVQKVVLQTLVEAKERSKATMIIVAHDMGVHAEVADRLIIMYAGKIVERGDVSTIFHEPLHPYVKALIECNPTLEKKTLDGIPGLSPSPLAWPKGCRFSQRCPDAMDICRSEEPPFKEIESGHFTTCHLYR